MADDTKKEMNKSENTPTLTSFSPGSSYALEAFPVLHFFKLPSHVTHQNHNDILLRQKNEVGILVLECI